MAEVLLIVGHWRKIASARPLAILLHRSAPSMSMRIQNCDLPTTHSWMTLFLSHFSHTADFVRCLLRAISRATDRRFMPRANYRFTRTRISNTSEHHCEGSRFAKITQSSETRVANCKYSSTKHRYGWGFESEPHETSVLSA